MVAAEAVESRKARLKGKGYIIAKSPRRRSQATRSPDKAGPSVAPSACPAHEENASARIAITTCMPFCSWDQSAPPFRLRAGRFCRQAGRFYTASMTNFAALMNAAASSSLIGKGVLRLWGKNDLK